MRPILFQIGPFPISSFGLFLLLAFVVSIALARRRAAPLGIDPSQMLDIALYMIIGGIVVGRLGYVVANMPTFAQEPVRIVTIWQDSGLVFYGAVLGGGAFGGEPGVGGPTAAAPGNNRPGGGGRLRGLGGRRPASAGARATEPQGLTRQGYQETGVPGDQAGGQFGPLDLWSPAISAD